jgi:decaprenyl-phosphate phosphoribosyltransferase
VWNPSRGPHGAVASPSPRRRSRPINPTEAALRDAQLTNPHERSVPAPLTVLRGRETRPATPAARALVLLRACRPRQWAKNVLVFAAPAAAGQLDHPRILAEAAGAFVVLCLVSSATYLVNDIRDREQDRLHPKKRLRPVAAGELPVATALRVAVVLALAGIGLAFAITPRLAAVAVGYMAVTSSYSLWWRHVVVLDILAIAAGFALRALAGGVATHIYLSRWFVLVTAFCAIYLVAAKRLAEQREHTGSGPSRATLSRYSPASLRLTLAAAAGAAGVAYISWAATRPLHVALYVASAVPFLLWLGRYAVLIAAGAGQAPEELILRDRTLLALSVAWVALFLAGVYVGR